MQPCRGTMTELPDDIAARELTADTWKDFEQLFGKYGGVQAGCWCMYYQRTGQTPGGSPAEREENNHRAKELLVKSGSAHGILVYSGGRAIGWCQFGPAGELPRIDGSRNYKALSPASPAGRLWRITCFFVDREYRHCGVARYALAAALDAIGRYGGGTVEAYPVTWNRAVNIWFGTVSMFRELGFSEAGRLGRRGLLMRKDV